jgi:hypothetical protein
MTDRDKGLCCAIKGLKLADPGKVRQVFWFVLHALACLPLSLEELFMHEYRHSNEEALGRTLHKTLRLIQKCLLFGLMAAISLDAQHSAPSVTTSAGVVRTVAGEPVAKAKVTLFIPTAKENQLTAVTGSATARARSDSASGSGYY